MPAPRNRTLVLSDADRHSPVPRLDDNALPDRVYCSDALEGLKVSPAADLIFADPPYDAEPDWHGLWLLFSSW